MKRSIRNDHKTAKHGCKNIQKEKNGEATQNLCSHKRHTENNTIYESTTTKG